MPAPRPPAATTTTEGAPTRFPGFEHITGNFLYCPNQFFDVCLPHFSRGAARLVAYMLRRTLGWLDHDGQPVEQDITVTFRELIEAAGISRGAIRPVIDEVLKGSFLECTHEGRPNGRGEAAASAGYRLRFDPAGEYVKSPDAFRGFYAGEGHRSPIPNAFFDRVVPREPLAVVKVVGTVLRHTVGYQNQFGGRRSEAPLSYSYIQQYANLADRSTLSDAIRHALSCGYIRCVSAGVFDPSAGKRRPAAYAVRWLEEAPDEPRGSKTRPEGEGFKNPTSDGSKTRPADRFKNPTKERTQENDTFKQQHEPAAVAAENSSEAIQLLRSVGFDKVTAAELAQGRGVEEIKQQIDWLPKRTASRNRLGLLRRAIEENWAMPTAAKQQERHATVRQREQSQAAEAAQDHRERRAHHERLLQTWNSLSTESRLGAVKRAAAKLNSAFVRARIERFEKRGLTDDIPLDLLLHLEPYLVL